MRRVRITLLGEASACAEGKDAGAPRALASIFGFLLLQPRFSASRDRLADALWPGSSDAAARHALASALYRLRTTLPECEVMIIAAQDRFTLSPVAIRSIDVVFYERCVDRLFKLRGATRPGWRRRLGAALAAASGQLLEGVDAEWAALARERWRCRRLDALVMLADLAARAGDWPSAARLGREVCAAEPLREDSQRLLIDALARLGNRGLALRQFEICARVLRDELNVTPMAETRALVRQLRDEGGDPPSPAAPLRDVLVAARADLHSLIERVNLALAEH